MTMSDLLKARYAAKAPQGEEANPVLEVLLAHKSVRAYEDRPVSDETLATIIAAAQSASTSSGLQTWSVISTRDPEKKAALAELCGNQFHVRDCAVFTVWLADLHRLCEVSRRQEMSAEGAEYLELFLVACIDAALAAQNAAVAAESMGLGLVYIGGMRNSPREVARILDLPPRTFAVFGMCLGHPKPDIGTEIKPRLPQSLVWHEESYDPAIPSEQVEDYDKIMRDFYIRQQMKGRDWSRHSARRVAGPESLAGRDALLTHLKAMGFPMK